MKMMIQKKISAVLRKNKNIRFAFVFGSRVKAEARFGSDLDIAVYFDRTPHLLAIGELVNELEEAAGCNVDLISLNDLFETNPKLAYSVLDEGVLLFSLDDELFVRYKERTFLSYLDFKGIIDLFDQKLEERINNNGFAVVQK